MKDLRPETLGWPLFVLAGLAQVAAPGLVAADGPPRRVVVSSLATDYAERVPEAKAELLSVVNAERRAHGAPPLRYDLLGAEVGDEFCVDAARNRTSGHWDLAGRAPYLRWALAGGVDHHAQNFAAESRHGFAFTEPPSALMQKMHAAFMAERPPNDGHRTTVLDPKWTHVGFGYALVGGELRMTEEFSRRVVEWVELPAGPVKAGTGALVTLKLPPGWNVGAVEVAFEEFPKPMSRAEIAARLSYGLPPATRTLRPYPPPGTRWESGERGDFRAGVGGRLDLKIPLDRGPGNYFVIVFGSEGAVHGKPIFPIAVPLVVAR